MRAFIAIELPKEIKNHLLSIQEKLKTAEADIKWVEPQNIHLTLKFLGEIDEKKLKSIAQIIEGVCAQNKPFCLRISKPGAFPRMTSPRVIWVGTDEGQNQTAEIAGILEEEIAKIGIPREDKRFSSHITIGRTRSAKNLSKLAKILLQLQANPEAGENLEFRVTKITLFKSTLTPQGPVYEALKESSLATI